MFVDVKNTCAKHTLACTGAQDVSLVHTTPIANMHIHPRKHAHATVQQPLPHAKRLHLALQFELCPRNCWNPRQPMAQPQLRCHTGII
jgi:hypothetical protein